MRQIKWIEIVYIGRKLGKIRRRRKIYDISLEKQIGLHGNEKGNVIPEYINSLEQFKSTGPDSIFPVILQNTMCLIQDKLQFLFDVRSNSKSMEWIEGMFIPKVKVGNRAPSISKYYRPISLSSVFLIERTSKLGIQLITVYYLESQQPYWIGYLRKATSRALIEKNTYWGVTTKG